MIDELKEVYCSEMLANRLDGFVNHLQQEPSAKGLIIFHGKTAQEGKNLYYLGFLKAYLKYYGVKYYGVSEDSYTMIRGENKNQMLMQFWIVPFGATSPKPERQFIEEPITKPTRFDVSWADMNNYLGGWTIYRFEEWGCNMDLNMKRFAEILKSNPKLIGYVVVYTQYGKSKQRADKVAHFALKELINLHKTPRQQLKTIWGGSRKEPEVKLWFVPKGMIFPKEKSILSP